MNRVDVMRKIINTRTEQEREYTVKMADMGMKTKECEKMEESGIDKQIRRGREFSETPD